MRHQFNHSTAPAVVGYVERAQMNRLMMLWGYCANLSRPGRLCLYLIGNAYDAHTQHAQTPIESTYRNNTQLWPLDDDDDDYNKTIQTRTTMSHVRMHLNQMQSGSHSKRRHKRIRTTMLRTGPAACTHMIISIDIIRSCKQKIIRLHRLHTAQIQTYRYTRTHEARTTDVASPTRCATCNEMGVGAYYAVAHGFITRTKLQPLVSHQRVCVALRILCYSI